MLVRGAAAAGVAWAAPVIRTTKAYATGASDGTERPCTHFYIVCINRKNRSWPMFPEERSGFPPSWKPEPVGNGWPKPWDGRGHPPWQSGAVAGGQANGSYEPSRTQTLTRSDSGATRSTSSGSGRAATSYTYEQPHGQAGPGRSVGFTDAPVVPTAGISESSVVTSPDAKIRSDRSVPDRPDDSQFGSRIGADLPDPLPPPILDWIAANPGIKLENPKNEPVITQTGRDAWAALLPAPPHLPDWWARRCRLILGCYKNGNEFGGDAYPDPNPRDPDQHGRRLIFPTRPERYGGYIGRSGRPGDFRDDDEWEDDEPGSGRVQRTAGPGRAVGFGTPPATPASPAGSTSSTSSTLPATPDTSPDAATPETPRVGKPPVAVPDENGQIPGVDRPRTDEEQKVLEEELLACGPDETLPFPWNLEFPLNLVVSWYAAHMGLTLPPPPPGSCVPPEMVVVPIDPEDDPSGSTSTSSSSSTSSTSSSTSSSSSSSSSTSSSTSSSSSSSSSTPTSTAPPDSSTTSTTGPVAHAASEPNDRNDTDTPNRPDYPHAGHFDEHECIILIFCCP
ncbi:MAG TPA: hypothetical protein VFF40_04890 [Acidimicrobiia bacterium]|nr:hypothetical protein [Acidimicrobiia bacterium]